MRLIMLIIMIWLYAQFDTVKQKIALPDEVETAFITEFPQAKEITWDEQDGIYEIDFMLDGMVQCEYFIPGKGFIEKVGTAHLSDNEPEVKECETQCIVK